MKTSLFLMFVCVFSLMAGNVQSQNTLVSLNSEKTQLVKILDEIESQTEFLFVYKHDVDVTVKKSIYANKESVSEVLDKLFAGTSISYKVVGKHIILTSTQQNNDIKGIVVDVNGEPLIGVSISVKGTTSGTVTDVDGAFYIQANPGDVLVVSYIGYKTQEIKLSTVKSIKVVLSEDVEILDEVVVVGYGTSSNRKLVSSVSTVKTEKVQDLPFNSNGASLQGRVAGLIVQNSGGEPGNPPSIYIRGGGTPLYVIDGIIRTADDFNALTSSDIENISVLKDASATAVYGAQAGNGIVLITTKKGGSETPKFNYTAGFDWSRPTVVPDRATTQEYTDAYNRAYQYDGNSGLFYTPEDIAKMPNVDWYNLGVRSWAPEMRHNLNMSGKSARGLQYYNSINYLDQGSIFKEPYDFNNTYKKYNIRSSINQDFEKIGLNVGMIVDGSMEKRNPNTNGQWEIWRNLLGYMKSIQDPFNPDGTYSDLDVHPLAWLDRESGYDHQKNILLNMQLNATWSVPWVKGLKAGVIGNYNYSTFDEKAFYSQAPQYSVTGVIHDSNIAANRSLQTNHWWKEVKDLQLNLEYEKAIGKHYFDVQGVYTYKRSYLEETSGERRNFASFTMDQMDFGGAANQKAGGMAEEMARIGWVGRVRYNFADKYFFEGNFRYDGSDNFAPGYRWGFFPSGAVAWAISEENFMQSLKERHIIDFMKIRASYGKVGLEDGVSRFGYKSLYSFSGYGYVFNNAYQPSVSEGNLVDPENLSWYTQKAFDLGLDVYTLNNKLNMSLDYFYYKTTNYLMAPQDRYVTTLGKSLPQIKSNSELRRQGLELSIRYKNNYQGLHYEIGANFTTYDQMWALNESEDLDQLMNPRKRVSQENLSWGQVYKTTGIYKTMDEILNAPRRSAATELRPGDLGYVDVNGDGKIDSEDMVRFGKPFKPTFDYGIDFNLDYKGFFLYGLFQGTGSRYTDIGGLMKSTNFGTMNFKFQMNSWTPDNPSGTYPRVSTTGNVNSSNNTQSSDYWMVNASYFRLKTLQFGYDFKYSVLKKTKFLTQCKLSLAGTNLFTISDAMDYFDPETADNGGQAYPVQKTLSVVLNVGF